MAKRKFEKYTVDYKKDGLTERADGLYEVRATITGDIEIGIFMDTYTWRGDWLTKMVFGKDAGNYRMLNVTNSYATSNGDVNHVIAVFMKER